MSLKPVFRNSCGVSLRQVNCRRFLKIRSADPKVRQACTSCSFFFVYIWQPEMSYSFFVTWSLFTWSASRLLRKRRPKTWKPRPENKDPKTGGTRKRRPEDEEPLFSSPSLVSILSFRNNLSSSLFRRQFFTLCLKIIVKSLELYR